MAFDNVPWLVDGGAVHSAEVSRTLAYVALGGAEGVVGPLDLKVSASSIPDGRVRNAAGACGITNTYPSQSQQSYVGRNTSDDYVNIAPTAAAGRSDLVIARIDDPQYGGTTPTDPAVGPYIKTAVLSNVGAGVTEVPSSVLYPAVALARIDIPASTGTITNAMITDVRKLINPRASREIQLHSTTGTTVLTAVGPSYMNWPRAGGWQISIPTWATKMIVIGQLGGIRFGSPGAYGNLRIKLGTDANEVITPTTSFNGVENTGNTRDALLVAGQIYIPAAYRGTNQVIAIQGSLSGGTGSQRPDADFGSTTVIDIEFVEAPAST